VDVVIERMENPVVVATFRSRMEAEVASNLLARQGIPFVIQSPEGMQYGPLPQGARVLVRPRDLEAARTVLEDAGAVGGGENA